MVQMTFVRAVTLFIALVNCVMAEEREPISSKNKDSVLANKLDETLFERSYQKYSPIDQRLMIRASKMPQLPVPMESSHKFEPSVISDVFRKADQSPSRELKALTRIISDWIHREEIVRKRAQHRAALCHFKICSMGAKRSMWEAPQNENYPEEPTVDFNEEIY